jgi:hypothetical protein
VAGARPSHQPIRDLEPTKRGAASMLHMRGKEGCGESGGCEKSVFFGHYMSGVCVERERVNVCVCLCVCLCVWCLTLLRLGSTRA